jgi:hypothetical protein
MYLWKAWHDCRPRVILYALATLSVGVLSGLEVIAWSNLHASFMPFSHQRYGSLSYNQDFRMDITFYALMWTARSVYGLRFFTFYVSHLVDIGYGPVGIGYSPVGIGYGPLAMLLAGLSLGASSVGKEYGAETMNFLLTRPAPRWKFILVDWIVGLTGTVIILGGLAYPLLPFLRLVHAKSPGNVLAGLPALWVLGAAIYGLSYFTTLVAGSAPKGLILSVATILTYFFLPNALHEWWHTDVLLKPLDWTLRPLDFGAWPFSPFEWGPTVLWLTVAAGFLGASAAWIRFREV